jgi:hypothetical protein
MCSFLSSSLVWFLNDHVEKSFLANIAQSTALWTVYSRAESPVHSKTPRPTSPEEPAGILLIAADTRNKLISELIEMQLKWGILGCGKISADFVSAIASLPESDHRVVACAARSLDSAKTFATSHGIERAYGSYDELLEEGPDEVTAIYVGAINPQHGPLVKAALLKGKAVLCEKPLCVNVKEMTEVVELAREKKLFLMEVGNKRSTLDTTNNSTEFFFYCCRESGAVSFQPISVWKKN